MTTPDRMRREVCIEPDPRLSNLRPGWLADDQGWRDQLQAMDLADVRWVERQWDLAGGVEPRADTSWLLSAERESGPGWPFLLFVAFVVTIPFAYIALVVLP